MKRSAFGMPMRGSDFARQNQLESAVQRRGGNTPLEPWVGQHQHAPLGFTAETSSPARKS
jgi:hypothetical protein